MGTIMSALLGSIQRKQHETILLKNNNKKEKIETNNGNNNYFLKLNYKKYSFGLGVIIIATTTYSYFNFKK